MNDMLGIGGLEAARQAFKTLQDSHPDALAKLAEALKANREEGANGLQVTAALREAARSLAHSDQDAARILLTLAELLAEVARQKTE